MGADSFIIYIKTEGVYKDTQKDVEKRFYTSNYETERPLPIRRSKKGINER